MFFLARASCGIGAVTAVVLSDVPTALPWPDAGTAATVAVHALELCGPSDRCRGAGLSAVRAAMAAEAPVVPRPRRANVPAAGERAGKDGAAGRPEHPERLKP